MNTSTLFRSFRALLPALQPEYRGMLVSYLTGTASALALATLGVLTAWGVGYAVISGAMPSATWWITVTVLVLVRTVLTWQEMDVSHALAYRVLARLRMALFDSYARSVPGRNREHSGHVAAVVMGDIEKLEFFYAHTLTQLATSVTVFIASCIVAFAFLPPAGFVLVCSALLITCAMFLKQRETRILGEQEQQLRAALSAQVTDALGSIREVLSYNLTRSVITDALDTTERSTFVSRRRGLITQAITGLREVIVAATIIGVIISSVSAAGTINGHGSASLSPAMLPALIALTLVGVSTVADAATTLSQLQPLAASADRVDAALKREPVTVQAKTIELIPEGRLGVRLHEVSLSYNNQTTALDKFSAQIEPGEHVGIAGSSGAGKSTLIALLARLWAPSSGTIELVNAQGIVVRFEAIEETELRRSVALVDQEATLFHGSVRDNLLRGTASITDQELCVALERVGATGWGDLDQQIGQGGLNLSGGQRTRLALARALIRQPRILLIDEVTASLDSDTERTISGVLADYPGTVVIASHRRETLKRTHRVLTVG